jgi:hypothetical protein
MYAAQGGWSDIARLLLSRQVDMSVTATRPSSKIKLHPAGALFDVVSIAEDVIANISADATDSTTTGSFTAFAIARINRHKDVVEMLRLAGAAAV